MTGLHGKVVVVTGAARGTGRVHCARFADAGTDVIALDMSPAADDLDLTAAEVRLRGSRCVTGLVDVRDLAAMRQTIDAAVSSTSGLRGTANSAHYSATRHGVVGLMQSLANELGGRKIRVNTVHPGAVGTAMVINDETFRRLRPDLDNPTAEDVVGVLADRHLLPVPWVDPEDVSNAVMFLASDNARYITGTQLIVDAGLSAKT